MNYVDDECYEDDDCLEFEDVIGCPQCGNDMMPNEKLCYTCQEQEDAEESWNKYCMCRAAYDSYSE